MEERLEVGEPVQDSYSLQDVEKILKIESIQEGSRERT
jgi:hypothetical protein